MSERDVRERDILVAANEYAYVQDLTKGDIVLYVGPTKISLSNTERIVELRGDRFVPVRADDPSFGVSAFLTASSAQYIVLENPAKEGAQKPIRGSNGASELLVGRKIVVPGPATFPLLPGQRARVIDGHPLREDEYLVVRYYDQVEGDPHPIGSEVVVRGSDVSFYIPRTGLEVVPSAKGSYVRKAWRFPRPGGLHVRVTKPITVGEDEQLPAGRYEAGADVFLEDGDGYFFPSEHVEVIAAVHPIPIAEKEGIYVRDRATGRIATITGPTNYLPDPTREEVVPRLLPGPASVYVPPSFAVLVLGKTKREVVVGPMTRILDYDEELEVLRLSTDRPKSDEHTLETTQLQIDGNKVSDVVRVKTSDHVELDVTLSYRVSFVARGGDRERWFHVKDYVGLLCDHLGSILRAASRSITIDQFSSDATEVLRTAILGEKKDGPRPGKLFEENQMWVYDVEVLDVKILDAQVKKLLDDAQRAAIVAEVTRREHERRRQVNAAESETFALVSELERRRTAATIELRRMEQEAQVAALEREAEIERRALDARVAAFERQMAAIAPELVATLRALGHQQLTAELSRNVAPLAILGGESVTEVVTRVLGALPVGASSSVAEIVAAGASKNGGQASRPRG